MTLKTYKIRESKIAKFLPLFMNDAVLFSRAYKRRKKISLLVDIPWIQFDKHENEEKPMKVGCDRANMIKEKKKVIM